MTSVSVCANNIYRFAVTGRTARLSSFAAVLVLVTCRLNAGDWTPLWTTATLSQARYAIGATVVGNEVFFAGGRSEAGGYSSVVDIYNTSTGLWSTANLSLGRSGPAATSVGNLALFAGGDTAGGTPNSTVDIYNTSTGIWSTESLSQARWDLVAASAGNEAFFAGGFPASGHSNVVDIYNTTTSTWSTAALSQARSALAAGSVGNQVVFGGGDTDSGGSNVVDIYNTSTGSWSTATLSQARDQLAATAVGSLVLFGGGEIEPPGVAGVPSNAVDIYNTSTGSWSTATLSQARNNLAAASVGDLAFFAGGGDSTGAYTNTVDIYNSATGSWSTAALTQPRIEIATATCGNQVFFAGGQIGESNGSGIPSNVVDIYTLQSYPTITSSKTWTLVDQTTVTGRMQINAPGSLSLGNYNLNVGSMSGNAPIDLSTGTLTVGCDNTNTTFSGNISDAGDLGENRKRHVGAGRQQQLFGRYHYQRRNADGRSPQHAIAEFRGHDQWRQCSTFPRARRPSRRLQ